MNYDAEIRGWLWSGWGRRASQRSAIATRCVEREFATGTIWHTAHDVQVAT